VFLWVVAMSGGDGMDSSAQVTIARRAAGSSAHPRPGEEEERADKWQEPACP
jgi:predicted PP-loop superfamily ATPase